MLFIVTTWADRARHDGRRLRQPGRSADANGSEPSGCRGIVGRRVRSELSSDNLSSRPATPAPWPPESKARERASSLYRGSPLETCGNLDNASQPVGLRRPFMSGCDRIARHVGVRAGRGGLDSWRRRSSDSGRNQKTGCQGGRRVAKLGAGRRRGRRRAIPSTRGLHGWIPSPIVSLLAQREGGSNACDGSMGIR